MTVPCYILPARRYIGAMQNMTMRFMMMIAFAATPAMAHGWQSSARESAGLAPLPSDEPAAVIQAYAARVWGWRGLFADHTWISVKPQNADSYTVYEVIGWRLRRGLPAMRIEHDIPDRRWYGNTPRLLLDIRGEQAEQLAKDIAAAAEAYPYPKEYRAFPGPNSNTFTAWIAEQVPLLGLRLPWRAIGKGFIHRS